MNMQDFYTGHAFDAYEFFGAHTYFGGTHFAVWAPSAQHIAVETEIGTFDLHRTQSAVWECDAPGVQAGMDAASSAMPPRALPMTNGCRNAQNALISR